MHNVCKDQQEELYRRGGYVLHLYMILKEFLDKDLENVTKCV